LSINTSSKTDNKNGKHWGNQILFLLIVFVPLVVILPSIFEIPFPSPDAPYSDFATTHLPNLIYLKRALFEYHTIPLWSPMILSGYPFLANPLSGIFYIFNWIALFFRSSVEGINFVILLHLILGGVGLMVFLKLQGINSKAAIFGGGAFALMPKLYAHYGAGHVSLIFAVSWTPWLLVTANIPRDKFKYQRIYNLIPGIIMAFIFYADVRWAIYSVGLWIIFGIAHRHYMHHSVIKSSLLSFIFHIIYPLLVFLFLISPLLLPLLEYTNLSTRNNLSLKDTLIYSLPVTKLLNLFLPENYAFHEWEIYTGGVILILAVGILLMVKKRREYLFWIIIAILSIIFALGENIQITKHLFSLPGIKLLRVPSRSIFLFEMSLIILAAFMIDELINGLEKKTIKKYKLMLTGIVSFVILISFVIAAKTSDISINLIWSMVVFLSSYLLLLFYLRNSISKHWFFFLLLLICLVDLMFIDLHSFYPRAEKNVYLRDEQIAARIHEDNNYYRIYSPSYSISQQTGANFSLEFVYGIDPLQLITYSDVMEKASGIPFYGYSVTLPPFKNGDPSSANKNYTPDTKLLGLLNVKYIVSEFDIKNPNIRMIDQIDNTRIYQNADYRPRAWIESVHGSKQEKSFASIEKIEWSPNHIHIKAYGPGMLVVSEVNYPGWIVDVDNMQTKLLNSYGLLRSVELDTGLHEVDFYFKSKTILIGLSLGTLAILWILCQFLLDIGIKNKRKN